MAKSRSQIQREYRERKKLKEGKSYLKKESARVLKYYVPSEQLSDKDRKRRNKRAKLHNQAHRRRKKTKESNLDESASSGYDSVGSPLLVKIPLAGRKKGGKRKNGRALSKAYGTLKQMKDANEVLYKKFRAKSKQFDRLKVKVNTAYASSSEPCTPNRKTESELRELNLTPRRREKVKRKLMVKNVIMHEISLARASTSSKTERRSIARLVSGKVSQKYRQNRAISQGTGLCRRTLKNVSSKKIRPDRRVRAVKQLALDVESFLCREDNSRTQPGKADAVKSTSGEKRQTVILTSYLSDLHQKFLAENPQVKVSLATFCRLRPRHVLLARFISRTSCLCIKHQNMALKCQTLKKYNIVTNENPENLLGKYQETEEAMNENLPSDVTYRVWKQVVVDEKKKMKVIEKSVDKTEFIELLKIELDQFSGHVERVRNQYRWIKTLKEKLPEKEIIVQMDFAENYTCKSLAEVQSAYWNQTPVTIHPVVVYFRGQSNVLEHKSIAVISDELSHSTSTVCTILDNLIPVLKEICPNTECVHYWTDSPSSQYRNKTIFNIVASHFVLYGIKARWNYFESGHGKGPCDGLGGTIKRMADEAVKRGAAVIQDAKEFFNWSVRSNMKEVKFLYVEKEQCKKKLEEINKLKLKPIKGTMKLHAVAYDATKTELCTRITSCYCDTCIAGDICEAWDRQTITCVMIHSDDAVTDTANEIDVVNENVETDEYNESEIVNNETNVHEIIVTEISVEDIVACVYENRWYIGRILDMDDEDIQVTFLEKAKAMFKWPTTPDIIWCNKQNVIHKLDKLEPSGKSQRFWKIAPKDREQIEENFGAHINANQ